MSAEPADGVATSPRRRLSRRGFLATTGVAGGLAAAGVGAGIGVAVGSRDDAVPSGQVVDVYGPHQAGIATTAQDRLAFAAFDVTSTSQADLVDLLRTWTDAIVRMTSGQPVADDEAAPLRPPRDTGEAFGLPAARLTVTLGFGPSLFDGRFGLSRRRPAALADLPRLPGDAIRPEISGGDLCVQACADDPQVAFHAVRNLRRLATGVAVLRWFQLGFGKTSSTSTSQATPRNLMGFKDGTNNLKLEDAAALDRYVWVGDETDQPWLRGGSYVVVRRIRMLLEAWDRDRLADQEAVFGRVKSSGAPIGAIAEHDPVPLAARGSDGQPVIPANAHIRLASADTNGGVRILRRGYSFTDGINPQTGELDAGLFFIAFQKDPQRQFLVLQRRLAASDALNEYIVHESSGVYACPPGIQRGEWLGQGLFA